MLRRGPAVLRGVAHIDNGGEVVSIGAGENGLQQRRIEGPNPERVELLILRGQHQVSGDDGGIDLRPHSIRRTVESITQSDQP